MLRLHDVQCRIKCERLRHLHRDTECPRGKMNVVGLHSLLAVRLLLPTATPHARDDWTTGEDYYFWPGALPLKIYRDSPHKTTATMANVRRLIHHGRPPSRAASAARGATNLISGLRGTFCGSAAVMGGSGAE